MAGRPLCLFTSGRGFQPSGVVAVPIEFRQTGDPPLTWALANAVTSTLSELLGNAECRLFTVGVILSASVFAQGRLVGWGEDWNARNAFRRAWTPWIGEGRGGERIPVTFERLCRTRLTAISPQCPERLCFIAERGNNNGGEQYMTLVKDNDDAIRLVNQQVPKKKKQQLPKWVLCECPPCNAE